MANKPVLTYSVTGRRVGLPGMQPVATDDANALLRLMHSAALHLRIDYLPANNVEDIRFFLPVEAQYKPIRVLTVVTRTARRQRE